MLANLPYRVEPPTLFFHRLFQSSLHYLQKEAPASLLSWHAVFCQCWNTFSSLTLPLPLPLPLPHGPLLRFSVSPSVAPVLVLLAGASLLPLVSVPSTALEKPAFVVSPHASRKRVNPSRSGFGFPGPSLIGSRKLFTDEWIMSRKKWLLNK